MKKYQLTTKVMAIFGVLFTAALLPAQSITENYVQSKICLSGDCSKKAEAITYFDGLGRPKQVIAVKATPTGKDLVTPVVYDGFGRQTKDILPTPVATKNSSIHPTITNESTANTYYGVANAYAEKEIEKSPLDRVFQQANAGEAWKMSSGRTQKFKYEANAGSDVKKFVTNTSTNTVSNVSNTVSAVSVPAGNAGYYPAGKLYKNVVIDEDGNPVTQFINGRGQTLLIRKSDGAQNIDTYYVYNEYNQKAFVIPAKALQLIQQNNNVVSQSILNDLCYQYRYDGRDRLVEKKLPGKDWEYIVYDKQDRPVLVQDGVLRTVNNNFNGRGWIFTKYDESGRVAYSGFFSNNATRQVMQNTLNTMSTNPSNNETRSTSFFTLQGINVYYTKNAFPTEGMTLLTVNYYDTYPRDAPAVPTTILGQHTLQQILGGNDDASTNSLPTVAYVKNIEDDAWTKTFNYYDSGGKLIATNTINHLGGYTNKELKLDYIGQVDESYTTHAKTMGAPEIKIKERFIYDNQQRLVKQYHQVNSQLEELLADNTYNDLGQLINKKTGNTTGVPLQSIDQSYNIRGWLTKVNDPANLNGKLFAYELKYQNPVYSTVSQGKYNGNIAEVDWVSADDGKLRRYNYKYDGLERLKDGIYSEPATTAPRNDYYNESLSYDVNGNIMSLKRNRYIENTGRVLMDDLGYTYMGNRLTKVNDTSGNYSGYPSTSGNAIAYDTNGNMINHIDKGMLQIDYNFLNLPTYIKFDKQYESHELRPSYYVNTKYLYNAQGTKLRKIHTYGTGRMNIETIMTTDYLDGFQYTNNELSFVPTSEGYYDFVQNKYIYNYTDHQGNIRLAYYKDASGNLQMDRVNHYYPFGLEFGGDLNLNGTVSPNYKYSTHGKEKQEETGWSDFGGRMYMPDNGRWFSPDPLSEEFEEWSPYSYVFNNPIRYVDPDGKAPIDVVGEGDGCCGNFFKGVKEGFIGRIDGIKNFVSDPYGTTKNAVNNYTWSNYGDSVANSLTFGIYGTAKTVNKAAQGDTRSAGQDVGGVAFDAAVAGATAGIAKGLKGKAPVLNSVEEVKAGKYSHLKEPNTVGDGLKTTSAQRKRILAENKKQNNGKLISDGDGRVLNMPKKNVKGQKADMDQAEIDHIKARSKGGSNSNGNMQVLSKEENIKKSNK